jgi:hypothetical protein
VDAQGAPASDTTVLAVQKTWPNNRYRQQMLKATTDEQGRFAFEDFAQPGRQYAFLLTVVSDKWLMTSEYHLVRDGSQQDPVTLTTEQSEPVSLRFVDAGGKPVPKVQALPSRRFTRAKKEYLNYAQQVWNHGVTADENGEIRFASWKAGEQGEIVYLAGDEIETAEFTVPETRSVTITFPARPEPSPSGPPVHVAGQVVDAGSKPLANVKVLAIQKTWPNNRYRQDALSTTTNAEGKFRFDKFATGGRQYAFLLTVIADGYAMTSEYQLVRDGSQAKPVVLKLEPADPVTLVLKDSDGQLLAGIEVSPNERIVDPTTSSLNYFMHHESASQQSDRKGQVSFTAWKPGESGTVFYRRGDQTGELNFTVPDDRAVELRLP